MSFDFQSRLGNYSLFDALRYRRSRRFAVGMKTEVGPLAFSSSKPAHPLSEEELAALAFAACGVTGYALADLVYADGQGGTMMGGFLGRTVGSADAVQPVSVVISSDDATYWLKRPQDFERASYAEMVALARRGELTELFRRSRVKLADKRLAPPLTVPKNLDVNQWEMYQPGTTYFVPINEYTHMYINGLLEFMNETMAVFVVDERHNFRPAGIARFGKSKGGHLIDDPHAQRTLTIERIEGIVHSVVQIEQGMMLQNLGLMAQAMGIGGFPNFAGHEFAWFEALGFRMHEMSTMAYLGANRLVRTVAGLLGKDPKLSFPVGLEHEGAVLLKPYCPPYYPSMEAAVRAVVEQKFGAQGIFRKGIAPNAWKAQEAIAAASNAISERTIETVIAYCTYIYETYGRFPAYAAPFRTSVGFQASHLDHAFYEAHYQPEALSDTHRAHHERWHAS
ncbi:MAG: hypothetical protein K1X64_19975 [Myxococcaceae bacterium]|nr:hypothetical protein [Myxococcaceae bacterium]